MRKHKDFMGEPDYGYIDIESCFEPIFEPPLETLEEWRSWEDEPEPTLENTSVYVTEPDGIQYFYCGNTRIRVSEHFSQAGKPMDKLIENVIQYAARNAGYANAPEEKSYAWTIAQVKSILQDETYIGNSVHNKQTNISYKNKKKVRKPKEEWIRVENTHEAIISRDVFEQVQKQIASRRRQQKDATTQIFAGLVKCADCGWSMRFGTNRQNKTPYSHFTCSQYGQMGTQCSAHYIRYDTLYVYVLSRIQYWSHRAQLSEEKLLQQILKNGDRERMTAAKRQESELKRAEKRKAEVDGKFVRMYEDWSAGRITEYTQRLCMEKTVLLVTHDPTELDMLGVPNC